VKWPLTDVPAIHNSLETVHPPPTVPTQIIDAGAFRAARIPIRTRAVAATGNGRRAPEPAAGIARGKSAKGLRARAIIAALRRSAVAALADGRSSGGFTPEVTVAAWHADATELSA